MSVTEAQVNADGKVRVANFVQPWSIEAVVVRAVELNVDRESVVMFEQFWNIDDISVTFVVVKLAGKLNDVIPVQPANMEDMFVAFPVLK